MSERRSEIILDLYSSRCNVRTKEPYHSRPLLACGVFVRSQGGTPLARCMIKYNYARCSRILFDKALNMRTVDLTDLLSVVFAQDVENFRIGALWFITVGKTMLVEVKGLFIATDIRDAHGVVNPFKTHVIVAYVCFGSDERDFLPLGLGLDKSHDGSVCCHDCFGTVFWDAQV